MRLSSHPSGRVASHSSKGAVFSFSHPITSLCWHRSHQLVVLIAWTRALLVCVIDRNPCVPSIIDATYLCLCYLWDTSIRSTNQASLLHSSLSQTALTLNYEVRRTATPVVSIIVHLFRYSSLAFEPHCASTPKKMNTIVNEQQLCSTPRPAHVRWSIASCGRPVDSSTPNTKRMKKTMVPHLNRLMYPSLVSNQQQSTKIWVL